MILTTDMLKETYVDYVNPLDKIKRDVDSGKLFRLKRGLYETNERAEPCSLAIHLVPYSYLSFEWALSYYGLIPERVRTITSASFRLRKTKEFENHFGRYDFRDVPDSAFPESTVLLDYNGYIFQIASREKTICDSLYEWPTVNSVQALKTLMFEDKRIYDEIFRECDFELMLNLTKLYKSKNLQFLAKLIKEEYAK